ncbi:MAG: ATP-binding protein [Sphaerochaetaceae bacterium]|nr:ATP-binding protein [Sphaerochaetaceae bacterium]
MKSIFDSAILKHSAIKVYALVGRSGTGKSFRAQLVADKYHIPLIVDDGLLIKHDRIIAGKSAKQENNFLTAVKRALFQDDDHHQEVLNALANERYHKILIIGTSDKMAEKIALKLNLPEPSVIIHIEDISSKEEIDTAMRIRYSEGKHVIPVPPLQITRNYPSIVYDSIKVGLQKSLIFLPFVKKTQTVEKTLVCPEFSKQEEASISEAAITQMVSHCFNEYETTMKVEKVTHIRQNEGYELDVYIRSPNPVPGHMIVEYEEYIADSLEKYGGILINKVILHVNVWS